MLRPARLCRAAQDVAAVLRTYIAPPGGTKAKREPSDRRRRELLCRNINKFQSQVKDHFRRQMRISNQRL